jgi:hypothetical protein
MNLKRIIGSAAVAVILLTNTASIAAASPPGDLAGLRAATAKYHSLEEAGEDGYGLFTDKAGIACIASPDMGAMGIHYVNGDLVGDPAINVNHPEALVYSPDHNGKLHLAAVEYVVLKDAWDATHALPPKRFGQQFNFTDEPNRYGLPPYYSLHVWVWKYNPAGMFEMWNPRVHCSCSDGAGS